MIIDPNKFLLSWLNSSMWQFKLSYEARASYSVAQKDYWLNPLKYTRDGLFKQEEPSEPELPQ